MSSVLQMGTAMLLKNLSLVDLSWTISRQEVLPIWMRMTKTAGAFDSRLGDLKKLTPVFMGLFFDSEPTSSFVKLDSGYLLQSIIWSVSSSYLMETFKRVILKHNKPSHQFNRIKNSIIIIVLTIIL